MRTRILHTAGLATLVLVGIGMFALRGLRADKATSDDLGGVDRYLTYLSTDKPVYKPGDPLYARGVVLHAISRAPWPASTVMPAAIQIQGPKGDIVASGGAFTQEGVYGFKWNVPADLAGGVYTMKLTYPQAGFAPAEREFEVRAYRAPRLRSQIVFLRDGYGPGDRVTATLHTERAEGGIPDGAQVTVVARVDEAEVYRGPGRVDARGNCTAAFDLPGTIARGEGTLAFIIEDGGVVETAAKTLPILLQTVDVAVYPEGGDLVAGFPQRVYIEARRPDGKPADIAGVVIDSAGQEAAMFRTEHEGRGRFTLSAEAGKAYTLQITQPAGIKTRCPLPAVKEAGALLTAREFVTDRGAPVRLFVGATLAGEYTVTLCKREVEVASTTLNLSAGQTSGVELTPPQTADGVLVATVWDQDQKPLAERLMFRKPANPLSVRVTADRASYVPGGKVTLNVKTTGRRGQPVSAVVGVTVTEDSVLEMIEKREQPPRLPVMVLLESEVRELADAHVYMDEADPRAPLATDLLLGAQGWRRFAFADANTFLAAHGDAARRVLAQRVIPASLPGGSGPVTNWANFDGAAEQPDDEPVDGGPRPAPAAAAASRGEAAARPKEGRIEGSKKPAEAVDKREENARLAPAAAERLPNDLPRPPRMAPPSASAPPVATLPPAVATTPAAPEIPKGRMKFALRDQEAGEAGDCGEKLSSDFVAFRIYAHQATAHVPGKRVDFTETLYWNAGIRTDAKTGEAAIQFDLSDAVTTFRVFADAFAGDGALGQASAAVESVEPFYAEPKLPLEVTAGDVIRLPVAVVNGTDSRLEGVVLKARSHSEIRIKAPAPFDLAAGERGRRIMNVEVGHLNAAADFSIDATAGAYADHVARTLKVVPDGFPVEKAVGGILAADSSVEHTFVIPDDVVVRSVTSGCAVYPTPLANLNEALERLIREPYGCFEQTSSTTYPLVMAQQYFLSHTGVDAALIERSRGLLANGYKRLIGFECKNKGYEWFASDPGHEALTAYGLLEFTDMARVREVDGAMLARTREWLLSARDGKGGFARKQRALHTWIEDPGCSNGYILWALLECGQTGLGPEVQAFRKTAESSANSYVVALAANVMALAGEQEAAREFMGRLEKLQKESGVVDGATTSIVGSGGETLAIETTALAALAWMREPGRSAAVEKAMKYLAEACKAGRYGSTQSTVLALRAIVTYDKLRARPRAPGRVLISVDGQPVGGWVAFTAESDGTITLPDVSELLGGGTHVVALRMEGGAAMPYTMTVNFNRRTPEADARSKVHLSTSLSQAALTEGGVTEAIVTVTNRASEPVPNPVAIIGLPGGLEPRHDQLKELVKRETVAAYEVRGREVVLYWRALLPEQTVQLTISLVATVPGTYTGPASRAYLYYQDDLKHWAPGLAVAIAPVGGE